MTENPTLDRSKNVFEMQKEDVQRLLGEPLKSKPQCEGCTPTDGEDCGFCWKEYAENLEQSSVDAMAVLDNMEEGEPPSFDAQRMRVRQRMKILGIEEEPGCPLSDAMGGEEPAPVYHWTTTENADKILREGLNINSFVCRYMNDYSSDVCLEISGIDIDWEHRDPHATWQAVTKEHISHNRIKVVIFSPLPVEESKKEKWLCPYRERCIYFQQKRCHGQIEGFCIYDDGKPPEEDLK